MADNQAEIMAAFAEQIAFAVAEAIAEERKRMYKEMKEIYDGRGRLITEFHVWFEREFITEKEKDWHKSKEIQANG